MLRAARFVAGLCLLVSGCTTASDDLGSSESLIVRAPVASASELPRGSFMLGPEEFRAHGDVVLGDQPVAPTTVHAGGWIIYMNRQGGTFTPGFDDATTQHSSIASNTVSLPAWNVSDTGWQQVMSCVKNQFAAYNVEVTDVDPGATPHIESVVAGTPQQLNPSLCDAQGNCAGGVSPWTSDCSVIDNSVVFTFAPLFQNNYEVICEVVAQEVSHSFGLDHELLCADPMTYLQGCGNKTFQATDSQCGEFSARPCGQVPGSQLPQCRPSQNSVQLLTERIGLRNNQLPTVGITFPTDGEVVAPGFTVNVDAADDGAVTEVELLIDGTSVGKDTTAPYSFTTDAALADGSHTVQTIARDGVGESSSQITVTVDANSNNTDPNGGGGGGGGGGNGNGNGFDNSGVVGGCAAAGSSSSSLALLLVGLALIRRRRS